jgi:hypothetical protein
LGKEREGREREGWEGTGREGKEREGKEGGRKDPLALREFPTRCLTREKREKWR